MSNEFLSRFAISLEGLKEQIEIVRNLISSAPAGLTQSIDQDRPGCIKPYELSEEEAPEIPLTPVTRYAIMESEQMGPLKQRELILLLSQKFDRRLKRTVDVVRTYDNDVDGVKIQLENLFNKIKEIEHIESLKSDFLHKRIRKILTAIRHLQEPEAIPDVGIIPVHELQDIEQFEEILTPAAKLALLESTKIGPLNEETLKKLLCERISHNWKSNLPIIRKYSRDFEDLKKQLESIRNQMSGIEGMEHYQTKFVLGQISKALTDLEEELYS